MVRVVACYASHGDDATIGDATVASELGLHERTVRSARDRALAAGYLSRKPRAPSGKPNGGFFYNVEYPTPPKSARATAPDFATAEPAKVRGLGNRTSGLKNRTKCAGHSAEQSGATARDELENILEPVADAAPSGAIGVRGAPLSEPETSEARTVSARAEGEGQAVPGSGLGNGPPEGGSNFVDAARERPNGPLPRNMGRGSEEARQGRRGEAPSIFAGALMLKLLNDAQEAGICGPH